MIENTIPDTVECKKDNLSISQFVEPILNIINLEQLNEYKIKINQKNDIILAEIKENQIKKKELEIKKQKLLQENQNNILNIKIQLKSNQLSNNER